MVFICTVVFFFLTRRPDWLNIRILTYGPEGAGLAYYIQTQKLCCHSLIGSSTLFSALMPVTFTRLKDNLWAVGR